MRTASSGKKIVLGRDCRLSTGLISQMLLGWRLSRSTSFARLSTMPGDFNGMHL
jgi:hypothetical protein